MAETQTVASVMQEMEAKFKPEKAQGITATFQFDITGEGGGTWHAVIEDGNAAFSEGPAPNPTVTITSAADDWIRIVNGQLNPQMAFMTGKIKVQGNLGLATKLGTLFL